MVQRNPGRGMATASFYCGFAATVCGAILVVWAFTSPMQLEPLPVHPRTALMMFFFSLALHITALTCGILAILLGSVAGSKARKAGAAPAGMGRLAVFLGILGLALLIFSFGARILQFFSLIEQQAAPFGEGRIAALAALAQRLFSA